MKISGIIKTSLIDYSGHLTTTIFTQGCNFKCPYCHNPELIPVKSKNKDYMDLDYFWDFLDKRAELIDAVTITGGEPTLQPDLVEFIEKVKDKGFKVKLDTNGSNPDTVKKLIKDNLLDYIAMDVKGSLENYGLYTDNEQITSIDNIKESIEIIKESQIDYEFRTTVVPGLHDEKELKKIAELIAEDDKYVLQNFKPTKTYNSHYENKTRFSDQKIEEFEKLMKENCKKVEVKN